ncbi:MAG TPA: glycoside hydrolase family 78 protein [Dongiaceae bacterium]|nr:glycoside hydrolase family 78 protein [Dongiaceae bacterium]
MRFPTLRLVVLSSVLALNSFAGLQVDRLRCEYLENPLGIDAPRPRLNWIVTSPERAQMQRAYQILVASDPAVLAKDQGDLWDSGKVASDQTTFVAYAGKPLASRQACFWKVRSWDNADQPSAWSTPASWEMGLLAPNDWHAQWIARTTDINEEPAPLLRREFQIRGQVKRARVYLCGLGYYELHLNGQKVGDQLLDPGYTRYDRRDLYVTHDVTALLQPGTNAVGAILGNGWFNVQTKAVWNFHQAPWREAPKLLLALVVDYADGRMEVLGSDPSWKTATGPIVFNSIYGGENYDARQEKPGWDRPGYDDSTWTAALGVTAPKGQLVAQMMPPIKADQIIKPVKVTEPKPGVFVFDLGQNFAGFAELKVQGPAGTQVTLRYGERLFSDGSLNTRDIAQHIKRMGTNQQYQTDNYILKGEGVETWHSHFDYDGFQYVEVTGFPGTPTLDALRGIFIHSAVPVAGHFECSNPLLNKIWTAARWSYLSNLQGIPTDCPHREKNGWTGDAHLAAEQAIYNFMPAAVDTKWVNDLGDEQRPSGELPGIVPTSGWGYEWGNGPAWDSAFALIPYYLYEYYGDTAVLREHYAGLKRYVDYLTSRATNSIINFGLNDWAPYKTQTPTDITSTAYYYRDTQIVALTAALLGNAADAQKYRQLAEQIKTAFNAHFYNATNGLYGNGSQTSLSCALYQGLTTPENQDRVLTNLVAAVAATDNHIDTGILGAKYILHALTAGGRADVAYQMASQKDRPSWGNWIEHGATTLWEQWNGTESRNHIMFGDISAWFYEALAGINADPAAPGFKHFSIAPHPPGDLTYARAEYESIRGRIVSDWKIQDGRFQLHVIIPANTTASVHIPNATVADVQENGQPAAKAPGVVRATQEGTAAILEVGSGEYQFSTPASQLGK